MKKAFLLKLFEAFSIQRWNDQIRPVIFTEMDKTAHKMIIAYCIAKYEEDNGSEIKWNDIIKGGVYELLRRIVLSDIKSPVQRNIRKNHKEIYEKLNEWVYEQLENIIDWVDIKKEFRDYLCNDDYIAKKELDILKAAHIYASYWEFSVIKNMNPHGFQIDKIDRLMLNDIGRHLDLVGFKKIMCKENISSFIDLLGQTRFQIRWSQTPRIPKTSVLGHTLMVAIISYFFTREINGCQERLFNNFYGGIFHDLPEAVTRDIISPVKNSVSGLSNIISSIEDEMMGKEVFPLIEESWHEQINYFIKDEFCSKIKRNGNIEYVTSLEINKRFNSDEFSPIDGELIKISDHLAAFIEAYVAISAGIKTRHLEDGMNSILKNNKNKKFCDINIGAIYEDFK